MVCDQYGPIGAFQKSAVVVIDSRLAQSLPRYASENDSQHRARRGPPPDDPGFGILAR